MKTKQIVEQIRAHMNKLGEPMPKKGTKVYYELVAAMKFMNYYTELVKDKLQAATEGFYSYHLVTFDNKQQAELFLEKISGCDCWVTLENSRENTDVNVVRYFEHFSKDGLSIDTLWLTNAATLLDGMCWCVVTNEQNLWATKTGWHNTHKGGAA